MKSRRDNISYLRVNLACSSLLIGMTLHSFFILVKGSNFQRMSLEKQIHLLNILFKTLELYPLHWTFFSLLSNELMPFTSYCYYCTLYDFKPSIIYFFIRKILELLIFDKVSNSFLTLQSTAKTLKNRYICCI